MANGPEKVVADLIVERLVSWGVDRIYGYAGDGNNPLLGAMQRAPKSPELIRAKHEEGAAFMAVGDAKFSGKVGVVTSTQGPGAVHLLNPLYDAKLDSVPVVALIAHQHTSVLGSGYQQEVDLPSLFQNVGSAFIELVSSPEQLPMVIDRAFRSALANSKPAVVILPHDIQQSPAPELGQEHGEITTAPMWTSGQVLPRDEDLDSAAAVINEGERVALLVGRGARAAQAEVIRLAERIGAGIVTSLLGKPYVDESHPLSAGTMGHLGTTSSAHVLQNCDTLIVIGSNDPWTEYYPAPGAARAVQIDIDPAVIGNRYPVEVGLVGDSGPAIDALISRLDSHPNSSWADEVKRHIDHWHTIALERSKVETRVLNPELMVREFGERIPADAQVAIDVGSCVYHYVRQIRLPTAAEAHLSSTLASMGCAVPYGIGAKESEPTRPVVAIAGDGAMQMLGVNELMTVAERWTSWSDPRFILLVLHNEDLAEVTWEQREMESSPRFEASQGVIRFDFAGYAELLGLRGLRIDSPAAVSQTLDEAFATDRPVVIEALTDPDVPLLAPLLHSSEVLTSLRSAIEAEGGSGARALKLLDEYIRIEEQHQ